MRSTTLIRHEFLPVDSVRLGRLVRNVDEPQSDYLDPDCDLHPESVIVKPHLGYEEMQENTTDKTFTAVLTRLVSATRTKRNKMYTQVTTDRVTTYQLGNSGSWFKAAIKTEATREWVKESIDQGDDTYLVVGYDTMLDARVVEGAVEEMESSAQLEIPVTTSLAAAGIMLPLGDIADPGVAGNNLKKQGIQRRFIATGEQICAVQYRRIRFKWFSSRDLDRAVLEKENRWKIYWNIRGQEEGTNDVLEADLQDELELAGDHEKYTSDTEDEFLF